MTKLHLLVLLGLFAATLNAQQQQHDGVLPSPQHSDGVIPPQPVPEQNVTTTVKPSSSSPKPTPEPPKPTPEPPKPTPEPPKPPTQPTKPPTQPTKSSTPPTPTTKPPNPIPPSTPAPPSKVDPTTGTWMVNNTQTNMTCLLVRFAMQIQVPYNTTFNKTYTAAVDVPSNASATGQCDQDKDKQVIHLQWNVKPNGSDSVVLTFQKNNTKYQLSRIDVSLTADNESFPGYNGSSPIQLNHNHPDFETTVSKSYKCDKQQKLNLTRDGVAVPDQLIYISHLQFQAFHNSSNPQFTTAEDCAGSADTPDIVPIAVGCALAALVIIVLIAYLIGRRRRQARGYLSMFSETKRESDYIPMKNLSCFQ